MANIQTIDNYGLPFVGRFLQKVSIIHNSVEIRIFPGTQYTSMGGQTPLRDITISNSMLSPIIGGSVTILDAIYNNVGHLISQLIAERDIITIEFYPYLNSENEAVLVSFKGIITEKTIITDDAQNTTAMSGEQKYRVIVLTIMNADIAAADESPVWTSPKAVTDVTGMLDLVAWIADDGSRGAPSSG